MRKAQVRLKKLLRVEDVAEEILGVSPTRVYQLIREGIVPAVRLGRSVRIDEDALRQFIKRGGRTLPAGGPDQPGG